MFDSIFFDLDGTLLNTIDDLAAAGNYMLSRLGYPSLAPEQYKLLVGDGIPRLVERLLPKACSKEEHAAALALFIEYYQVHCNDFTCPYPNIPEALFLLKEKGICLSVLTNKDDSLAQKLINCHFPGIFDLILGQTTAFPPKPNPESLLYSIRLLSPFCFRPVFCGDSSTDILTAHNANLLCCSVSWGFREKDELIAFGADYLIDAPAELISIVSG